MAEEIRNMQVDFSKIYVRKVILADESEWIGSCSTTDDEDVLWVWLDPGPSMAEVFMAFNDPEKTGTLKDAVYSALDHNTTEKVYEGYTALIDVKLVGKSIQVCLKKA